MKEIKFRGKRVDNGEWVEGFYVKLDNTYFIIEPVDSNMHGYLWHKVIPETVGQFTGLYDNTKWADMSENEREQWTLKGNMPSEWKGREIFEGDIVKIADFEKNYIVKFTDGCFNLYHFPNSMNGAKWGTIYRLIEIGKYLFEVIGNIHDKQN